MKKTSIRYKAASANSNSRSCGKCKFYLTGHTQVCQACSSAFIEGYQKGYKQCKKDLNV